MGSGAWSTNTYSARATLRAVTGTPTFDYSTHTTTSVPHTKWKAHERLDPNGVKLRESRDSDDHPTSRAATVLFDVTGSMLDIPQDLQKKLPELLGLLLRKGYLEHPHVLFGAIGDATCDRVPFQIGQWEADNRMDDDLEHILLEGGGGGQMTESYELGLYFMARHTAMDCYEKRGEKGFLFLIGDEMAYPKVKAKEVRAVLGDEMGEDIPTSLIVAEAREKFHLYFILPKTASHGREPKVLASWRALLGQNVVELDDPNGVCETIALLIGLHEGIDLEDGVAHLKEVGVSGAIAKSVSTALAEVAASTSSGNGGAIVHAEGGTLGNLTTTSGNGRRL